MIFELIVFMCMADRHFFWQVKHERALGEQANTYLQLLCSTCDLSEPRVRNTAGSIQEVKLQVKVFKQ